MIPLTTNPKHRVEIYKIATDMAESGLSAAFVSDAVDMALEFEGAYDLMVMWTKEDEQKERDEIVADLQEEIDNHKEAPKKPLKKPYIKFEDLEPMAKKIQAFKYELRKKVDRWGGISKLAKETGIPQPSLSRFFSSASIPRRTTLYRIAEVLELSEKEAGIDLVA